MNVPTTEQLLSSLDNAALMIEKVSRQRDASNRRIEELTDEVAKLTSERDELKSEVQSLAMNLADTEALEIGTSEVLEKARIEITKLTAERDAAIKSVNYLKDEVYRISDERDAALEQVAKWVAANGPEGWIDELRQEAKWRIATCQENEQLKSKLEQSVLALREAKEDIEAFGNHDWDCKFVISNFEKSCTCWHSKAIATINNVLGDE